MRLQFGAYVYVHALCSDKQLMLHKVPGTDIEARVLVGGVASGLSRAAVEVRSSLERARRFVMSRRQTPLEYYKVQRQTGGKPVLANAFRGLSVTAARASGLMTTFFVLLDVAGRQTPDMAAGAFFRGGVCATLAWWTVWPLEVAKSQIQAGLPGPQRLLPRLRFIVAEQGGGALTRGLFIGSLRSVIANGASMYAFAFCQRARAQYL